jgi:hypothetical protein
MIDGPLINGMMMMMTGCMAAGRQGGIAASSIAQSIRVEAEWCC